MGLYTVQRAKRLTNWNTSVHTSLWDTTTDDDFEVPLPAIILLGVLGFCLIIVIILYLVLQHNQNKLLDKVGGKGRDKKEEYETSLLSEERSDLDDEEQMFPVSGKEYVEKHDEFYAPAPPKTAVLVVSVTYSSRIGRLFVEIIQLESIAKEIKRSDFGMSVSVHARLQPLPEQFRHKTTSKNILKPIFNEKFAFDGFCRSDLKKCWFRFRIYSHRTIGRSKILGQVNVGVMEFEVDGIWSTLKLDVAPSEEVHRLFK
ncbi:uncharacterized protein LOC110244319 [Exaiptasia diaphana]|uniref:C2 domain-containing protein n=1 Tax=Exaiptasia diaphana TaxID=2652724 RepID=A0A913XKC2_EXADI|nr:uncharacterized protein LOC110244319 [Exaiptasia diaphana]KXJ11038.1 hypothetical protein AC249_AIPGENE7845 [Exaiptasia diaphana]